MRKEISDSGRLENMRALVSGTVEAAANSITPETMQVRTQARSAGGYSPANNGVRVNGRLVVSGFLRFNSAPGLGANK